MNNTKQIINWIRKQVRSSRKYADWVKRNKALACLSCGTIDNLACHHPDELNALIRGMLNMMKSKEDIVKELINMHDSDTIASFTLCEECHEKVHKIKKLPNNNPPSEGIRIESWCVIPHPIGIPLAPSRSNYPVGSLGFIAFQSLFGIGYHFLNGDFEGRMHQINARQFARLIGKKPSTSFNTLLNGALRDLQMTNIVAGYVQYGSIFEIHLTKEYVNRLKDKFWFFSIRDVVSKSITCLSIKHILLTQQKRYYGISMEKLCARTGLSYNNPAVTKKYVKAAVSHIPWASVKIEKNDCIFTKKKLGYPPTHSLREMLDDSIRKNQ